MACCGQCGPHNHSLHRVCISVPLFWVFTAISGAYLNTRQIRSPPHQAECLVGGSYGVDPNPVVRRTYIRKAIKRSCCSRWSSPGRGLRMRVHARGCPFLSCAEHHLGGPVEQKRSIGLLPRLVGQRVVRSLDHPVGQRVCSCDVAGSLGQGVAAGRHQRSGGRQCVPAGL